MNGQGTITHARDEADAIWAENAAWLLDQTPLNFDELGARLGGCRETIERTLLRTGRRDLLLRLRSNRTVLNASWKT